MKREKIRRHTSLLRTIINANSITSTFVTQLVYSSYSGKPLRNKI